MRRQPKGELSCITALRWIWKARTRKSGRRPGELTQEFLKYLAGVYKSQSEGGHLGEADDRGNGRSSAIR